MNNIPVCHTSPSKAVAELLLPSAYLAPIDYYQAMVRADVVLTEQWDHYVKQTFRNRCVIAGPNGQQVLTIPVEKPEGGKSLMKDLRISDHGNWRHLHWNALESSYGKSPFFEYYADDLRPFYEQRWTYLMDYNEALQQKLYELLDIEVNTRRTAEWIPQTATTGEVVDLRHLAEPSSLQSLPFTPYYQVFAQRHGFQPHLSIVDLLFNMGPESILVLTSPNNEVCPYKAKQDNPTTM